MKKKYLLTIIIILFTIPVYSQEIKEGVVFPGNAGNAWEQFYIYANSAEPDTEFPLIEKYDLDTLSENTAVELMKADKDGGGSISINEYFLHCGIPQGILDFVWELDNSTGGKSRGLYGKVLGNFSRVETVLGSVSETSAAFMLFYKELGIDFTASETITGFIADSVGTLPDFIRSGFYTDYEDILDSGAAGEQFMKRHGKLIGTLSAFHSDIGLDGDLYQTVKTDLKKISPLLPAFSIYSILDLYGGLKEIYFREVKVSDLEIIAYLLEKLLFPDSNIFREKQNYNKMYLREKGVKLRDVSDDWSILVRFLRSKATLPGIGYGKIEDALTDLINNKVLYLELRRDLSSYLNSFFRLQYETSEKIERIAALYIDLSGLYSEKILSPTAEVLADNTHFLRSRSNGEIAAAVKIVFSKTAALFEKSLRYFISQTGTKEIGFSETVFIYNELTESDISLLINRGIRLKGFEKIIQKYRDNTGFYLPLFVRTYLSQSRGAYALTVINQSIPFHEELEYDDITIMITIWNNDFYNYFFSLLEFSINHADVMLPLTAEKKVQLLEYIGLFDEYHTPFNEIFKFTLDVYSDNLFSPDIFDSINRILEYLGREAETNRIFTSYYLPILKEIYLDGMVLPEENTAYKVIDILKGNAYMRPELAGIFLKSIEHLKDPVVLDKILEISELKEYSPDIFISIDSCSVPLDIKGLPVIIASLNGDLADDEINRDIFTYALKTINELFEVNKYFSEETLSIIYRALSPLKKEKREVIISSLPKINYLKKKIIAPEYLEEQIPFLVTMNNLESDLFDEFISVLIPVFEYLIESGDDIVALFEELDNANRYTGKTYPYFEDRKTRADYFTGIFPLYAPWIKEIGGIREINDTIIAPLGVWREEPKEYLKHLGRGLNRIALLQSGQGIADTFGSVAELLTLTDTQSILLSAISSGSDNALEAVPLGILADYLSAVKGKQTAVEYGKKQYFNKISGDTRSYLSRIVNASFPPETKIIPELTAAGQFDINSRTFLAGGGLGIIIPFHRNYLNYRDQAMNIDLLYLYNITTAEHEVHTFLEFIQPLFHRGLSKRADSSLFLTLGGGGIWNPMNIQNLFKYFGLTAGLNASIDFLNTVKLQIKANYTGGFYGSELLTNRITGALILSFKL